MILGNILPPIPIKVHQFGFGIALIFGLFILSFFRNGHWLTLGSVVFLAIQFSLGMHINPIEVFDFLFGPTMLMSVAVIMENQLLSREELRSARKRFFTLAFVPLTIACLQYFDLLPIKFLNATYVNHSSTKGTHIERINGFFYHGNELVVLSYFLALNMAFGKSSGRAIFWLIMLILFSIMTLYKSLIVTSIIILGYFVLVLNKKVASMLSRIPTWSYLLMLCSVLIGAGYFLAQFIQSNYIFYGLPFKREMLTGRGGIWTVYLYAIEDFTWFQHFFGAGIGSEPIVFGEHMTPKAFYPMQANPKTTIRPHPHNPWLGYYINAGWVGILFLIALLKLCYTQYKKLKTGSLEIAFALAFLVLPFLSFGVTIYITEMAVYWICLAFTLINAQYKPVTVKLSSP